MYRLFILMSIKPKYANLIYQKEKKYEIRKTIPKALSQYNLRDTMVYLYESGTGNITGWFSVEKNKYIEVDITNDEQVKEIAAGACLTVEEFLAYANGKNVYAWPVKTSMKYALPARLIDTDIARPPQSWQYLDEYLVVSQIATRKRKKRKG